jgi:hypothetical protein
MNIVLTFIKLKANEALNRFGSDYENAIFIDLKQLNCCNMNSESTKISIYCEGKEILKNSIDNLTIIITGDRGKDGHIVNKLGKIIKQQFGVQPLLLAS